jgi:DNA ligase-associated metallophosphoesterase
VTRASIEHAGLTLELLPERAAYCSAHSTLLVSDLHLGKSAHHRAHGIPLDDGDVREQIARLRAIVEHTGAERTIVVGDLVHSRAGLAGAWTRDAAAALRDLPTRIVLVEGNHDARCPEMLDRWGIENLGPTCPLGPVTLVHDPADAVGPAICGHVHPVRVLRDGGIRLRLPCFWMTGQTLVLPAFSPFTGGAPVRPTRGDRVFVVADREVIDASRAPA